MQDDFNPEMMPGEKVVSEVSAEQIERANAWETAMSNVPEMGEEGAAPAERNEGIADAASLINYGLNAAARELGVETVVQKIKTFDASGSDNPIRDLYIHLGIDEPAERMDLRDEARASQKDEIAFRESENAPATTKKSVEGALEAIRDFKELVLEVEGADPRYQELRDGAKASGKGIFEYAVMQYGMRDLTVLFNVLAEQKEQTSKEEKGETLTEEKEEMPTEEATDKEEDVTEKDGVIDADSKNVEVPTHDEEVNLL